MASSSNRVTPNDMERNTDQQTEKKKKKKGVRASFKKGWRAVKGCCSCTQSNDLDPSEEPYLPVLNPVVLADTADHPGCDLEQTALEDPVDPPQDSSGLKQTAPEEPTDDKAEQQTEGKKKKKGVRACFKKGWQAMKHSCTRNNKVVPLPTQPDLDPSDPQPAPLGHQPPSEDPAEDRPEEKKKKKGVHARFKKGWQAMKHSCTRNNKVVPLPTQPDLDPTDPQPEEPEPEDPEPEDPEPEEPEDPEPEDPEPEDPEPEDPEPEDPEPEDPEPEDPEPEDPEPEDPEPEDPEPEEPEPEDPEPEEPEDPEPEDPEPEDPEPEDPEPEDPEPEDPEPEDPNMYRPWSFDFTELIEDFYRSLSDYDPYVQRLLRCFPPYDPPRFPAAWYFNQECLYELDKFEAFSALYELGKNCLGKGHSGIVYQGTRKSDGLKVAIKFMYKSPDRDRFIHVPGYDKPLYSEVAVNLSLQKPERCPNIVALLDWFEEDEIYILVLEYPYPCLSLKDFLEVERLSEDQARPLMRQAVTAAQHCIDHDVCHGSLEIRNILINIQTMTLMFIDFGRGHLASTWGKPDPEHPEPAHPIPRPTWVEPSGESWGRGHAVADTVSSLGKLLLCMMGGFWRSLEDNGVTKDSPELTRLRLTEECLDLINRSVIASPPDRPTLEEFLDHEWFKQG